jgi:hypothetical protein
MSIDCCTGRLAIVIEDRNAALEKAYRAEQL